jgi:hypothetical protein
LIIATKKNEVAIPKEQMERIDFRHKAESRMTKETCTTVTDPDPTPGNRGVPNVPGSGASTDRVFGSKPDFQTIYRAGER